MRKIIKLITLVITMLLLSTIALADSNISVQIQNTPVNFNRLHNGQPVGQPYIENNRTYIPVRVVSEDLGYNVEWEQKSQKAIITKGKTTVEITIGQTTALVNGVKKNIDNQGGGNTKAKMVGGRTYVPVRFISEAMGDKVEYRTPSNSDVKILTVYINCTNLPVEKPVVNPPTPKPPVVSDKDLVKPKFTIVSHKQSGGRDFVIYLTNSQDFKGLDTKTSPVLVSHPQFNKFKTKGLFTDGYIYGDVVEMYKNNDLAYKVNNTELVDFSIKEENDGKKIIETGEDFSTIRPKIGEILTYHIEFNSKQGTQVYKFDIPYRNFDSYTTNGQRIK